MNIQTADVILPVPMSFNSQTTSMSQKQKRFVNNYLFPTSSTAVTDSTQTGANVSRVQRFLLPSNYFLDVKQTYLSAVAQLTKTQAVDTAYFVSNTDCWISRVTVLLNNGVIVGEIRDANILGAILKLNYDSPYTDSLGKSAHAMWNSGERHITPAQQQSISTRPYRYNFTLDMAPLMSSDAFNYLPLRALAGQNSNSLQLEIEWAPIRQMTVFHGATGYGNAPAGQLSYNISSVYLCQDFLQDDDYEMSLSEQIKSNPIIYNYRNMRHYNNTIPAGTSQFTVNISEFQSSMECLFVVFRNQAFTSDVAQDVTAFMNPNLLQAQLQIGGNMYIPSQPMVTGRTIVDGGFTVYQPQLAEVHSERMKVIQKYGKYGRGMNPSKFDDTTVNANVYTLDSRDYNDLVLAFDLRTFPDDADGDAEYNQFSSGLNTKSNPQQIQLLLTMAPTATSLAGTNGHAFQKTNGGTNLVITPNPLTTITFSVDTYVFYRSNIVIQQNESYVIS
jgi:hypothetical protein